MYVPFDLNFEEKGKSAEGGLKESISLWYFIFSYKNLSHYVIGTTAVQVAICEEKGFFLKYIHVQISNAGNFHF